MNQEPGTSYDVRGTLSDPDGGSLDGAIVEGTASTRTEISVPAPIHSCHVSPSGSGTACTPGAPCSLTEGLTRAGSGDEIVLHDGIYYEGEFDLPRSGRSGAPIVIRGPSAGQAGPGSSETWELSSTWGGASR